MVKPRGGNARVNAEVCLEGWKPNHVPADPPSFDESQHSRNTLENLVFDPLYFAQIRSHISVRREITDPGRPASGGPILTNASAPFEGGAGNGETP